MLSTPYDLVVWNLVGRKIGDQGAKAPAFF